MLTTVISEHTVKIYSIGNISHFATAVFSTCVFIKVLGISVCGIEIMTISIRVSFFYTKVMRN